MLLQRLLEYSQRMDECPTTLYSEGPIHYYINLDQDGKSPPQLVNVADRSSPRTPWGQRRPTPQIQRSSGIRPLLMANKADYTLGYAANEGKIKRARKCHQAYLALVERCATWTKEPDVLTVLNFLKENPLTKIKLEPDFEPGGIISFVVNDRVIIDNPAVQAFWASTNEPEDNESQKMQCLVCGNVRPVLDRLQTKVKGIPGGQSSGTNIISANEDPYQSYGLHASLIAPTCYKCGEGFTKGLNRLLSSERNRLTSGNTALIFWTKEEVEFDFLSALDDPDPLQVHTMLQTVQTGQRADVDEEPFYALTLSASGSRAVIRDWVETTIGNAKLQLSTWFQRQHITSQSGAMPQYYGIRALARATVREVHDLPTSTPVTLLRARNNRRSPAPGHLISSRAAEPGRAEGNQAKGRSDQTGATQPKERQPGGLHGPDRYRQPGPGLRLRSPLSHTGRGATRGSQGHKHHHHTAILRNSCHCPAVGFPPSFEGCP